MNDVTFQKMLASVMLDNKYDRFVKNRKTGKLDTKSLYKINTSDKLFKRREARKNKHYSVLLLVDTSGSMSGSKLTMASEAADRLSMHLSQIGIENAVYSFDAGITEIKPFGTQRLKAGELKSKLKGQHGIFEKFHFWDLDKKVTNTIDGQDMYEYIGVCDEPFRDEKKAELNSKKINFTEMAGPGYNSDAEAVRKAREIILKQKGKKLLIVLSDGYPAPVEENYESPINKGYSQGDYELKPEVDITIQSGIEVYSIGIFSDAVKSFYPAKRTCAINDLSQLYPHIIHLVRLNLKRG